MSASPTAAATTPSAAMTGPRCGARTRGGGLCKRPAGSGTDHVGYGACKLHTGATPSGRRYAARLVGAEFAGELDISPEEALLWLVHRAAFNVSEWDRRVDALKPEEWTVSQVRERVWSGKGDEPAGSEKITTTHAELHIAVQALMAAEDQLAKYAKIALDAGVEERRVRAMEQVAGSLAAVFDAVFAGLELSAAQRALAPALVERHLQTLEASSA